MKCIRRAAVLPALIALAGCGGSGSSPGSAAPPAASAPAGSRFDAATAGAITGRVSWEGEPPSVPMLPAAIPDGLAGYRWAEMPNPFAPTVDVKSRGFGGAVVYLTGIEPAFGRPWDLPPVRVEQRGFRLLVRQGDGEPRRVGFVRRGDEVEFTSADAAHHMLRGRGAAFFTLPFPEPGKPLKRRLDAVGVVELSSGAGYFWAAADLLVDDHPYYALTDREGRFTLPQVPPGRYELVCRVRNWTITGRERDPESGLIFRQQYAAPVEKRTAVTVAPRQAVEHAFTLSLPDFATSPR